MPKLNLIIFDTAQCLVHPNPNRVNSSEHWLASNRIFFNIEISRIQQAAYSRVILAETRPADISTQNKFVLPVIQHHLQNVLPKTDVLFDPFWYSWEQETHKNFDSIANSLNIAGWTAEMVNEASISDVIALTHRAASTYADNEIALTVYAGSDDRCQTLESFFEEHSALLPNTIKSAQFARYANLELLAFEEGPEIRGSTPPVHDYNTTKGFTTAIQWNKDSILRESLLADPEKTKQLLGEKPKIEIEATPVAASTASKRGVLGGLFEKPPEATSPGPIMLRKDWDNINANLKKDYLSKPEKRIEDYIRLSAKIQQPGIPPTDDELLSILRQIASQPLWDEKGKSLNPLGSRTIPAGIIKVKDSKCLTFGKLAELVKGQHDESKTSYVSAFKRSRSTRDFYSLIVALADSTLTNWTREEGIKLFCEKHKLDYEIIKASSLQYSLAAENRGP